MKYKKGDKVRIKSLDWYNENKNKYGSIYFSCAQFTPKMSICCGDILTICDIEEKFSYYYMEECAYVFTDEMIEGLAEEGNKSEPKFHIGDWAADGDVLAEDSCIFIIQKLGDNGTAAKTYCALHNDGYFEDGSILYFDIDSTKPATEEEKQKLFKAIKDNGYKWNSETKTLEKLIEPLDVPTMTTDFVKEHGLPLPNGYIFKDQAGNEIHALKIVLEKANTLKIQSNNMETETHRGYYTAEEETTNKSKKVAWFTFGDNDFADKVELALSNRELIHEDGKWFVVKKKKEYPKTYEECCRVLGVNPDNFLSIRNLYRDDGDEELTDYERDLLGKFDSLWELIICRDAYWKIAGEEMGLGKPWEPDWDAKDNHFYTIHTFNGKIECSATAHRNAVLIFPTEKMRDAFYENFKKEIEQCKELL